MTRGELGMTAMDELAERPGHVDRGWLASLLDRAIAVGQEEIKGRIGRTLGPFVAETVMREDHETEGMRRHMPIVLLPLHTNLPCKPDAWKQRLTLFAARLILLIGRAGALRLIRLRFFGLLGWFVFALGHCPLLIST
jgi:hypothetical protein